MDFTGLTIAIAAACQARGIPVRLVGDGDDDGIHHVRYAIVEDGHFRFPLDEFIYGLSRRSLRSRTSLSQGT